MKLARYWTRQAGEAVGRGGERIRVTARGWSNESLEAAGAVARDIAHRMAQRIASNQSTDKQYGYGDRPLPEPVLREFRVGGDSPSAVITRNSYGSLVMNARDMMFVDIDRDDAPAPAAAAQNLISGVLSLFGKAKPEPAPASESSTVVTAIQRVVERHSLAVRVYKTAAGYRVLVVNSSFEAGSVRSEALLREFGSDALYVRLCKMQESFRARLTPKPWRCGLPTPPVTFPFEKPEDEAAFREWETKYSAAAALYATCRFVASYGSGGTQPGFEELIQYHDQETKAASGLALA